VSTSTRPKVSNIKAHFLVDEIGLDNLFNSLKSHEICCKTYSNFVVFSGLRVYIIFFKSGYVNVTGIKNHEELSEAIYDFCRELGVSRLHITSGVVIDNISAYGAFGKPIRLKRLYEVLHEDNFGHVNDGKLKYNQTYFPALFSKEYQSGEKKLGTILVYRSGKYTIVGAKCLKDLNQVYDQMNATILKL